MLRVFSRQIQISFKFEFQCCRYLQQLQYFSQDHDFKKQSQGINQLALMRQQIQNVELGFHGRRFVIAQGILRQKQGIQIHQLLPRSKTPVDNSIQQQIIGDNDSQNEGLQEYDDEDDEYDDEDSDEDDDDDIPLDEDDYIEIPDEDDDDDDDEDDDNDYS
eukprot:TRINITY_DN1621_c0_g1_i1.p2 TRINITY_DN1621_c0_g1~~TRINITY_DN1621_c0_g1_i1.p2  ORF type:complete len:161 (+),score=25.72 TRINITY_DN1621_c0_g1_i1:106-588(+)